MATHIVLPYPPTVNKLYTGKARRYKSKAYESWIKEALLMIAMQRGRQFLKGKCRVALIATRPDNRRRDLLNLEKAVCDILSEARIIEDDCYIEEFYTCWDGTRIDESTIEVVIQPYVSYNMPAWVKDALIGKTK